MTAWSILLVDDKPLDARLAEMALSTEGFMVRWVCDPVAALALLTRVRPHLILVDYLMPEMTGFEFANWVRNDPALAGIPVAITSAYSLEGDAQLLSSGCAAFIPKPIDRYRLAAQLRNCIQNTQAMAYRHH